MFNWRSFLSKSKKDITMPETKIQYSESDLCDEQDLILLDRLAEKLLGIKDISSKKDQIRKFIK
jgi:hypothetical protein